MKIMLFFVVGAFLIVVVTVVRAARHSKPPEIGVLAPQFTLNAQDGKPVSLQDFRGHWVVLYFYPKDFTSGCTKEARNFQRDLAQFEQKNTFILGVSGQDETSHEKFCATEGLHFKLLADTHFQLSSLYGSVVDLGIARLSSRHTFLIDPAGVIRKVYLSVNPSVHSSQILADLAKLQKAP